MQCKYCGKEYKTEAFLLKHESECKESTVRVSLEDDFMNLPIVEENISIPTTTENPVTTKKEFGFAYASPRNFKR